MPSPRLSTSRSRVQTWPCRKLGRITRRHPQRPTAATFSSAAFPLVIGASASATHGRAETLRSNALHRPPCLAATRPSCPTAPALNSSPRRTGRCSIIDIAIPPAAMCSKSALARPLPAADRVATGLDAAYRISLDGFRDLLAGTVHLTRQGASIILDWHYDAPDWTRTHPLRSTAVLTDGSVLRIALSPMHDD